MTTNEKYNEEKYIEDPELFNQDLRSYDLLKVEHEKCKQEIYDLKRKLQLNEAMLRDVNEANESLERLFHQRISENEQLMHQVKEKYEDMKFLYTGDNNVCLLTTRVVPGIVFFLLCFFFPFLSVLSFYFLSFFVLSDIALSCKNMKTPFQIWKRNRPNKREKLKNYDNKQNNAS